MYQNYELYLMCDVWQISTLLDKVSFLSNTDPTICWLANDPSLFTELYIRFVGRDFSLQASPLHPVNKYHPRGCATPIFEALLSVMDGYSFVIWHNKHVKQEFDSYFLFLGRAPPIHTHRHTHTHTHTHTHSHIVCRMKFAQVLAARQTGRWEVKGEDNE